MKLQSIPTPAAVGAMAIESRRLLPADHHFNAGLIRRRGELLLAYRYERHRQLPKIALAVLDPQGFEPRANFPIDLPRRPFAEDPRLFEHDDRLFVSYCSEARQHVVELDDQFRVVRDVTPRFHFTGPEKNWTFFSVARRLFCVYHWEPFRILEFNAEFEPIAEFCGSRMRKLFGRNPPRWEWGERRGGTPPRMGDDGLLHSFFHSRTQGPQHRVYVAGWGCFEPTPPFRLVRISTVPVLAPDLTTFGVGSHWSTEIHPAAVIFPCGQIRDGRGWLVSLGHNDHEIKLVHLSDQQLLAGSRKL